jgi:two-component system, OmpR family, response regulator
VSRTAASAPAVTPERPRLARALRGVPAGGAGHHGIDSRGTAGHGPDIRGAGGTGLLRSGDLVLDEERWTVHRAGTPVDLSPTEFRLLACLLRHQGTVLSKTQLLRSVWGWGYAGQPQVVETYVSYLRRKLGRPPLIYTCRGAGYVLRGPDREPGTP